MTRKPVSSGNKAALAALSRGNCYYPDCNEELIKFVGENAVINYDIAHIEDANIGNRYNPSMTDDERRNFPNLILLCTAHHKEIDKINPSKYSVDTLKEWKKTAESTSSLFKKLEKIDEDVLVELLESFAVDYHRMSPVEKYLHSIEVRGIASRQSDYFLSQWVRSACLYLKDYEIAMDVKKIFSHDTFNEVDAINEGANFFESVQVLKKVQAEIDDTFNLLKANYKDYWNLNSVICQNILNSAGGERLQKHEVLDAVYHEGYVRFIQLYLSPVIFSGEVRAGRNFEDTVQSWQVEKNESHSIVKLGDYQFISSKTRDYFSGYVSDLIIKPGDFSGVMYGMPEAVNECIVDSNGWPFVVAPIGIYSIVNKLRMHNIGNCEMPKNLLENSIENIKSLSRYEGFEYGLR